MADAFVRSLAPNKNYGTEDTLVIRSSTGSSTRFASYIRFDQAAIASQIAASQLDSAHLQLQIRELGGWGTVGGLLDVLRIPSSWAPGGWTETGVTWSCPQETNTANAGLDCPSGTWDTTGFGSMTPTDQVLIKNSTTGLVTFDVTVDVSAFLASTANHGWYLTKSSNNNSQRIVFRSRERPEKPRLILFTTQQSEPPAEPPDSLPSWIYSPSNLDSNTTHLPGVFVKNLVIVQFKPTATPTQRQTAINAVQGTVVGGIRFGPIEGYYYIEVSDTTGGAVLRNAVQTLQGFAYVKSASIEYALEPAYRRPKDDPDWSVWQLDPQLADDDNWALEAVAAPAAWGCSIGADDTKIAIVDGGMYGEDGPDDLQFTYHLASGGAPALSDHGFRVLSILGADGNNEIGMTGMMWKSDLHGYEAGLGPDAMPFIHRTMGQILSAALDGARVVNVSMGMLPRWPHADRVQAGELLGITLEGINGLPHPPLVVLAAGNIDRLADSAGFPLANSSDHPRLIVVAGSDRQRDLFKVGQAGSNYGPLIDVAAPGHDIFSLGLNNEPSLGFGTSFAAPLVSGIAGLLVSFDASLTAEDLKSLIVDGATPNAVSGTQGPYRLVNAYQSLRLAAQRNGAPLCGNRLWIEGESIVVDRGGTPETLLDVNDQIYSLQTWHGGRRVSFVADTSFGSALLSGGAWTKTSLLPPDELLAAGYDISHEGDRLVYATNLSSMEIVDVVVSDTAYTQSITVKSLPARWPAASPVNHCVVESRPKGSEGPWTCITLVDLWWGIDSYNPTDPGIVHAFHPAGDSIFIARPWSSIHNVTRSTAGCPFGQPNEFYDYRCYNVDYDYVVDSTTVYRAAIGANASLMDVVTVPKYIGGLTIGESMRGEMVLFTHSLSRHTKAVTSGYTHWDWVGDDCLTEFRSGYTNVTDSKPGHCFNGWLAPLRRR